MIDKRVATTLVSGPGAALAGFALMAPTLPHLAMTAGSAVLISAASYFSLAPDALVAAAPSVDPQAAAALLLLLAFLICNGRSPEPIGLRINRTGADLCGYDEQSGRVGHLGGGETVTLHAAELRAVSRERAATNAPD